MKNFVGMSFGVMMIMGTTLTGGYIVHDKVLKSELRFKTYETYVKCVALNEKDKCKFILN